MLYSEWNHECMLEHSRDHNILLLYRFAKRRNLEAIIVTIMLKMK